MQVKRPAPTQNEISFSLDEMFFSTTDQRGFVLDGNNVFIQISKYSKEEIIGAPHNIIRHPDMPKIVFKTLWDTILSGRTICAYVKNLAKDGSFYWVFATVIPTGDEFLSIRMKPTTHLKEKVDGLYKELLKIEKASGVDASLEALIMTLNALGFADYDSFSLAAISSELNSRLELQSNEDNKLTAIENSINEQHCAPVRLAIFNIFRNINKLSADTKAMSEQIIKIGDISKNIEFSAFNTIIEAERLGDSGKALAVIAQHISSSAEQSKKLNSAINTIAGKMIKVIHATQLSVALSTLQVEMLTCFMKQWYNDPFSMTEEGFKKNASTLTIKIDESLKETESVIQSLAKDIFHISSEIESTSQILMTLEFIQKAGLIESARLSESSIFYQLFLSIMNLIKESKKIYSDFSDIINNAMKKNISETIEKNKEVQRLWFECLKKAETTNLMPLEKSSLIN